MENNCKIAIISESFPPYGTGGINSAHYNLYRLLKEHSFIVKVFTFRDYIHYNNNSLCETDITRNGIRNKTNRFISNLISKTYKYQRKLFYKTDTYLTAYQFIDVVTANLGSIKINKELKKFGPQIVIIPDHGAPGYSIKKIKNAVFVHISHHNPIRFIKNPFFGYQSEYDIKLALKAEKKSLNKIDQVICPSYYMKDVFVETFGNNTPVTVIPNLIDNLYISEIVPIPVHTKLSINPDYPMVYIPSGGSSYKGERYVIEIIRRLTKKFDSRIGFYVSGGLSDIQKDELKHLNEYSKLVFAPGNVDYRTNIGFIKSCTVCISPTLVESFGMAILEANFCNLPAVSFSVGGNEDIIRAGQNGFLVPYLDVESLLEKAIYLIDLNTRLNAYNYVNSNFSTHSTGFKYINLFSDIINAKTETSENNYL